MLLRLIGLLTVVPIVELVVMLEVHRVVASTWGQGPGLAVTLGGIVLTGLLGATLARQQGLSAVRAIQESLERGEFPADSLLDGALILVGGAFLMTPGYVTDLTGFSLLIPWTRRAWRGAIVRWWANRLRQGPAQPFVHTFRINSGGPDSTEEGPIIDITPRENENENENVNGP